MFSPTVSLGGDIFNMLIGNANIELAPAWSNLHFIRTKPKTKSVGYKSNGTLASVGE